MKTKLTLLIAFVIYSFAPVFGVQLKNDISQLKKEQPVKTAKNGLKTGYFVLVKKCGEVATLKTESLPDAEIFIRSFYSEFCENLEYQFHFTPYYRVLAYQKEIYIEKMKITRSGKYKRIKKFTTFEQ